MSVTLSKDGSNSIHHGAPVQLKKCVYTGHAVFIHSVEHAISMLDEIGQAYDSDDCLPFALRLVEGSELIQISDDNGEFGAAKVILSTLPRLDGYNVLVAVSRHIQGCFVVDMVQGRKLPCVRQAAVNAVEHLKASLRGEGGQQADVEPAVAAPSSPQGRRSISPSHRRASPSSSRSGAGAWASDADVNTHTNVVFSRVEGLGGAGNSRGGGGGAAGGFDPLGASTGKAGGRGASLTAGSKGGKTKPTVGTLRPSK